MLCLYNKGTESHYDPHKYRCMSASAVQSISEKMPRNSCGYSAIPLLTKSPSLKITNHLILTMLPLGMLLNEPRRLCQQSPAPSNLLEFESCKPEGTEVRGEWMTPACSPVALSSGLSMITVYVIIVLLTCPHAESWGGLRGRRSHTAHSCFDSNIITIFQCDILAAADTLMSWFTHVRKWTSCWYENVN